MGVDYKCEICGLIMNSGCFAAAPEEDICTECLKAIADAREQQKYLKSLKKK